ncbi:MAG: response regulator [Magnetococcales bacterium]|nr:response regulator [Magnetococcales bacterium]NGZ04857.1 response regulator [Magnetococcales bacterium]
MKKSREQPVVLIVDDEPINIEVLEEILRHDYVVLFATDGRMALEMAIAQSPDLILLDIMMPVMDGHAVCRQLKSDERTRAIPVVFVTAMCGKEDIVEGLRLGAYYYLTKPVDPPAIQAVVAAALHEYATHRALREEVKKTASTFGLLESCRFRFRTIEEARSLAVLLANACPEPEKRVLGLTELMVNAVEHGNLGITYQEKSALHKHGEWASEVERRLSMPHYATRSATIEFAREGAIIHFLIRDQGDGFDWRTFMKIDPERAFDSHGRGIAMANMFSFDEIRYQGKGNEVVATLHLEGMVASCDPSTDL